jgi:hypothetical protein
VKDLAWQHLYKTSLQTLRSCEGSLSIATKITVGFLLSKDVKCMVKTGASDMVYCMLIETDV